jgi:hypothetical protein
MEFLACPGPPAASAGAPLVVVAAPRREREQAIDRCFLFFANPSVTREVLA